MADDDMDLDAMLEDAADDVLGAEGVDFESMLDDAATSILASVPASAPSTRDPKISPLQAALSSVLPPDLSNKWASLVESDATAQGKMPPIYPASNAYMSLLAKKPDKGASSGPSTEGKPGGPTTGLADLLLRACIKAGIHDTDGVRKDIIGNQQVFGKLQSLYLEQVAQDLKPRLETDPNFDPVRFPHSAEKILGVSPPRDDNR